MNDIRLSLLDQSPAGADGPAAAIQASVHRAMHAEHLGLHRIWYAEHHHHAAFAGTSPLIHAAMALSTTSTIRVGTGGVLAGFQGPRHVAAAFTTLERSFPGRVDAGLGRANAPLDDYVRHTEAIATALAHDGPPVWILGVGSRSAVQANDLGAGYAFGHFFNPDRPERAFEDRKPGLPNLVAARVVTRRTDLAARTAAEQFVAWRTRRDLGRNESLPGVPTAWSDLPHDAAERNLRAVVWGCPSRVADGLRELAETAGVDEVMISLPEPEADLHVRLLADVAQAFVP